MSQQKPQRDQRPPLEELHLWDIAAVRELCYILLVVGVLWAAFALRMILAPVLIAFALAYAFDPFVTGLQRRVGLPRVATTLSLLLILVVAVATFATWVLPALAVQAVELYEKVPVYLEVLQQRLVAAREGTTTAPASLPAVESFQPESLVKGTMAGAKRLFGVLGSALGTASYLIVCAVLIPVLFVFFGTYYGRLAAAKKYLPASRRDRILDILAKIDAAFSAYVRGQLIVAVFTTTGFCIGFYLADVPYWFVVSIIGGTLSLIPYGQMSGWLLAVLLKYVESQAGAEGFSWWAVLLAPSLVYLVTQSMESWVITPLVQGEAANLHPVTVLVVLIIGGWLAGIVGLILAVPVTASLRAIFHELAGPRLEQWARSH